jgi:hypothetical protein
MLPEFLRFRPVPLKARHDGWTPDLQYRFILALAHGVRPGPAAEALGMGRQGAYDLRRKPGGESFAWAWDEATRFARCRRVADRRRAPAPSRPEHSRHADIAAAAALKARLQASSDPRADRAAFDALLDRLYPSTVGKPTKPTNPEGAWHVSEL